jgi:hypothetical protein
MTKTIWRIYIMYEDWYLVRWAPEFDTEKEAKAFITEVGERDGWDGRVEAVEEEYEEDN